MSNSEKQSPKLTRWSFVVLISFFALLPLAGFYSFFREKSYKSFLNQLYDAQKDTETWLSDYKSMVDSADESASTDLMNKKDELLTRLDALADKRFSYIKRNAFFSKALIYAAQKEYVMAAELFAKVFRRYGNSILGVKAGLNAAASYENAEKTKEALDLYKKVSKSKKVPKLWEEASFHAARITETEDPLLAIDLYKKLINNLEEDNFWRILSENRLLSLEIKQ